jgi:serine protease Do
VLLKIDAEGLPAPEMAPAAEVRVGQWSIAIGRAFESDKPSMAVGIVSATGRIWGKALQTDAAVSPNNYGGPLIDIHGRVLGVLVPLSPEETEPVAGVEWYDSGIGFAIPSDDILAILPRLKAGNDLRPGLAGFSYAPRNMFTGEPKIAAVRPGSPAADAGLEPGDRVVEIAGKKTDRAAQVKEVLSRHYAGDRIKIAVLRDKKPIEREIELVAKLEPYEHPFLGILPMRTTSPDSRGTMVRYVYPDSPAEKAGLRPGDSIVGIADKSAADAAELRNLTGRHKPGEEVAIQLLRAGKTVSVRTTLGRLPEELPEGPLPAAYAGETQRKPRADADPPTTGVVPLRVPDSTQEAWAYVPENYPTSPPHGLVVWLDATTDRQGLLAHWKSHCQRDHLILLVPHPSAEKVWNPRDLLAIRALMSQVETSYRIDPTRLVVGGQKEGGTLALLLAFREHEHVRGAVAIEASVGGRVPDNEPAYRLALLIARSSAAAKTADDAVERLRELKYPVTLVDLGEKPRELNETEQESLARWIDTLDRI